MEMPRRDDEAERKGRGAWGKSALRDCIWGRKGWGIRGGVGGSGSQAKWCREKVVVGPAPLKYNSYNWTMNILGGLTLPPY